MRSLRRPAVTVAGITATVAVTLLGLTVSLRVAAIEHVSLLANVINGTAVLAFAVVGAVIAAARPTNRVGWLLLLGAACWALGSAGVDVAHHGLVVAPGSVAAVSVYAVLGQTVRSFSGFVLLLLMPAHFPDGQLPVTRRNWLGIVLVVLGIASLADPLLDKQADLLGLGSWHNPLAPSGALQAVSGLVFLLHQLLTLVALVGVVLGLRRRWRSGGPLMRQQLLLFLASIVLALAAIPVALLVTSAGGWVFGVAALPVSVAIGFAVLARGLYDLRTAADRTLVWVTLSAVLAALYAVVIIGITRGANVAGATWPTWLAAALIAVSFAPLRDALQRGINRLTFGRWDEPYDVLAALGQRLEATASVDGLLADVVSELGELGLSQVTVLDAAGEVLASVDRAGSADAEKDGTAEASRAASGNGARAGDGEELALAAFGKRVGTLRFRTATPLRASERRLLDDLAGHLGGVVHARALTIDLQRALERQVLAREEERRRLRRDLHDGLGPALAGHLLRLDVVAAQVDPGSVARAAIDELRLELGATVAEVRRVVEGLRPPALDELGLAPALGQVLQRLTAASSVALELEVAPLPPLTAATEVAAYRIATEAVTNVVRHSGASACTVRLAAADGWLRLEVSDNGRGLTGGGAGHGLQTMRERARELRGELTVAPAAVGAGAAEVGSGTGRGAGSVPGPGTGTTVVALLPLLTPGFEQTPPVPTPRLAPVTS